MITQITNADGSVVFQETTTVEQTQTVDLADLDAQIANLQARIDDLNAKKAAYATPDKVVDLRPTSDTATTQVTPNSTPTP